MSCALLLFGAAGCGVKAKEGVGSTGSIPVSTPDTLAPTTTAKPDDTTTEPDDTTTQPDDTTTEVEPTTTVPTTDGGGGVDSANPKVQDYCKAVASYVSKVKAAMSDPTGAGAGALVTEGQALSAKASALATAGLTAADAQAVSKCTQEATSALTGG